MSRSKISQLALKAVVIFITDKDVLGDDEPIYIIDRVILKSGKPFAGTERW